MAQAAASSIAATAKGAPLELGAAGELVKVAEDLYQQSFGDEYVILYNSEQDLSVVDSMAVAVDYLANRDFYGRYLHTTDYTREGEKTQNPRTFFSETKFTSCEIASEFYGKMAVAGNNKEGIFYAEYNGWSESSGCEYYIEMNNLRITQFPQDLYSRVASGEVDTSQDLEKAAFDRMQQALIVSDGMRQMVIAATPDGKPLPGAKPAPYSLPSNSPDDRAYADLYSHWRGSGYGTQDLDIAVLGVPLADSACEFIYNPETPWSSDAVCT